MLKQNMKFADALDYVTNRRPLTSIQKPLLKTLQKIEDYNNKAMQ